MQRRQVVAHIITGLGTGGAEHALFRLVDHGLADRFETHIVSLGDEGSFGQRMREAGATVHTLDMHRNPIHALYRLGQIVKVTRPALLQGWMSHGNAAASVAAVRLGSRSIPLLWNIRQGLDDLSAEKMLTRQVIRLNRLLSRKPFAIIYNSHRSREQHEAFGYSGERGLIIPNGFDLDRFLPDPAARAQVRDELGLPDETLLVGHFARHHPMKDHAGLLRAAAIALKGGCDAHFLLAGTGVSAASIGLDRLIEPEQRHRFNIFDTRSDIPAMMQAIDIYLSSSARAEGFPNVIGEAMASARPCIGTDIGDTGHVLGEAGILVPPSNPDALAAALVRLAADGGLRQRLGIEARRRAEERFDIDAVVDRYAELYQSVLQA